MQEQWVRIERFSNYEVSNLGNVRSCERVEPFRNTIRKRRATVLKKRIINGYYVVNLKQKNVGVNNFTALVHRLVAKAFILNPENKPYINHIDNNRLNNDISNLEWCTQKENVHHAMKLENWTRGVNHGMSKFTEAEIYEIRNSNERISVIAKRYNVAGVTISRIKEGKSWVHL